LKQKTLYNKQNVFFSQATNVIFVACLREAFLL
jgi:hypothetical protein